MLLPATLLLLASAPEPLILATYAYPKYDRAAALAPLGRLLSRRLGRKVEIALLPTPDALTDAVRDGRVDIAMTNLGAYARMARSPKVKAVAVLAVPAATLERYRGVLLARRATGLTSVAEVAARAGELRYSKVLPGSTSGGLVQASALRRAGGPLPRFAAVRHAGTHEAALDDLLAGRADVAALAEEPWRTMVEEQPKLASVLVEIWRSPPLPAGPVVCAEQPDLRCADVAGLLLRKDEAVSEAARSLAAGWSETMGAKAFMEVPEQRYVDFIEP